MDDELVLKDYLGERETAHSWLARGAGDRRGRLRTAIKCHLHAFRTWGDERAGRDVRWNAIYRIRTDADFNSIRDHLRYVQLLASQDP